MVFISCDHFRPAISGGGQGASPNTELIPLRIAMVGGTPVAKIQSHNDLCKNACEVVSGVGYPPSPRIIGENKKQCAYVYIYIYI